MDRVGTGAGSGGRSGLVLGGMEDVRREEMGRAGWRDAFVAL